MRGAGALSEAKCKSRSKDDPRGISCRKLGCVVCTRCDAREVVMERLSGSWVVCIAKRAGQALEARGTVAMGIV